MTVRVSSLVLALLGLGCSPLPPEVMEPSDGGQSASTTGTDSAALTGGNNPATTSAATGDGTLTGTGAYSGTSSISATTSTSAADSTGEQGCTPAACVGQVCLEGDCVSVASCRVLEELDEGDVLPSGVYQLEASDGSTYPAYCDMDYSGGGWTLVLKALGSSPTFAWDSPLWSNAATFNTASPDLDRVEARLASWSEVSFDEVLIGMEAPIGADPSPIDLNVAVITTSDSSLFDLMAPGDYVSTNLGRSAWLGLIDDSSLQQQCNREGFNVESDVGSIDDAVAQRIGIIANEFNGCGLADSRLGIGGLSGTTVMANCSVSGDPTGNFAGCDPRVASVNIPAFAVVFVR